MRTRLHNRGMTFIESLVWIAVFTFAMLALTSSILYFYRTSTYTLEQSSAVNSAQRGLEATVKSIREASYASNGAYPVASLAPHEIAFYAEVDGDAGIERVRYFMEGRKLRRGTIDPSGDPAVYTGAESLSDIADDVRNLEQAVQTFTYYDAAGAEMTDFTDVAALRYVTINLVVNVDPVKLPNQLMLRSSAALRNLR